ncbi:hypothetical protein [Lentibacter sp.]|uniref:hypothetical protein n=1 Tax=Lentibacter sp. TaxID=2024994 RepID=UPI003F6D8A32
MKTLRAYCSALLVAVLVLTGQAMAEARAMTSPAGEIVLCTGTGPLSILVDADGKPTGPPYICPDCALALFADITAPVSTPEPILRTVALSGFGALARLVAQRSVAASARGPPAFI